MNNIKASFVCSNNTHRIWWEIFSGTEISGNLAQSAAQNPRPKASGIRENLDAWLFVLGNFELSGYNFGPT